MLKLSLLHYEILLLLRIGSKLSIPLKTQLVHSMILSHQDYCKAILYNLPAFLERKLTKVLYAAVRFIFNIRVSRNRRYMLPYLKKLHFLPIKYRINFKIAMLTFKCLHGSSPQYLRDLVSRKLPSDKYNLRQLEIMKMCSCLKICVSVEKSSQNVCFHIHLFKFRMHYHFALEKLIIYKLLSAN